MGVVMQGGNNQYSVVSKDVLDSKNSAIRDLQYELARVCKVNIAPMGYNSQFMCSPLL